MKNTTKKHFWLSLLLLIVLSAAMVCSLVACDVDDSEGNPQESVLKTEGESLTEAEGTIEAATESESETEKATEAQTEGNVLGTGNVQFTAEVQHADGTTKSFTVKTDKTTVAEALVEVGLISGEDSQWGLYITTVNGEYHKWESDGKFWAFYVNGESSMVGASGVNVEAGAIYSFRAE